LRRSGILKTKSQEHCGLITSGTLNPPIKTSEPRSLFSNFLIGGCRIEKEWGRTGVMRGNWSERRLREEQPEWSK